MLEGAANIIELDELIVRKRAATTLASSNATATLPRSKSKSNLRTPLFYKYERVQGLMIAGHVSQACCPVCCRHVCQSGRSGCAHIHFIVPNIPV